VRILLILTLFFLVLTKWIGQAIQYLSAEFQPTAAQTPDAITQLIKDLAPYDLTKAEKLQVVNLAPTEPVELYVVRFEVPDTKFQPCSCLECFFFPF
jgi:RNA polymerase Rpb4